MLVSMVYVIFADRDVENGMAAGSFRNKEVLYVTVDRWMR